MGKSLRVYVLPNCDSGRKEYYRQNRNFHETPLNLLKSVNVFMIQNDNFDLWDHSLWEKATRCSSCYEMEEHEEACVENIKEAIESGSIVNPGLYTEYIGRLINKLSTIRREEVEFFPSNPSLDNAIQELLGLSRRLRGV
jgi:predicted adenine nucleotide alpha hydrolase (AANH) superfamily ATPase